MYTQIGPIEIDDEPRSYPKDTEETVCLEVSQRGGGPSAYSYINKDEAQRIVNHLNKAFNLDA